MTGNHGSQQQDITKGLVTELAHKKEKEKKHYPTILSKIENPK